MGNFLLGVAVTLLALAVFGYLAFKLFRRGPLTFEIDGFYTHVADGDVGPFIRDVQADVPEAAECRLDDRMSCSIRDAVQCHNQGDLPDCNVLLLSGGGQWGAYGAGLFDTLARRSADELALPGIGVITGISTGSLQALMLMVALDPAQTPDMRRFALDRLIWGYSPERESDVVKHTKLIGVPLYGSAAGTAPLRARIVEALMPGGDERLVSAIGNSSIDGFVGFVEAERGVFRYADIKQLVNSAPDTAAAAQALAAATMASSAMPVFHQQLRIAGSDARPLALYDGGVRRSIFFDRAMAAVDQEVRKQMQGHALPRTADGISQEAYARTYEEAAPTVYVVRNGPTVRRSDDALNTTSGPLKNGQRGYDLLVNESEIGAIAGLRLNNPYGRILLTSADRYDTFPSTVGENFKQDEMFKPAFMARLRDLGRHKAERDEGPWWPLSKIEQL
ncbi:patatin-like phospholipase family protein [Qipengyuania qiaonensis]|uniref:Patatin-like phospholipase family protein n=1 Tax=Qipengyuania qiaonensis TaxID=2867240 RepID=A0ABS7J3P9_9SPHN|nr:patatin-like phospholipase family protein [Qipengyuania qiaonensis]MBX7481960.1 patatin-like phospholipase family protein [Qipengyuania qiaonensis]